MSLRAFNVINEATRKGSFKSFTDKVSLNFKNQQLTEALVAKRKAIEVGITYSMCEGDRTASMSYNLCRTPPYLLICLLSILFFKTRSFLDSFDGWFVFYIFTNFLLILLLTILLNVIFCQIRWE